MNAIRSLRDYVDTVKQKRKQVQNKDKEADKESGKVPAASQLSSGSESGVTDSDRHNVTPKVAQIPSRVDKVAQPGQETSVGGAAGEVVIGEKSAVVFSVSNATVGDGSNHVKPAPSDRQTGSRRTPSDVSAAANRETSTASHHLGSSTATGASSPVQSTAVLKEIAGKSVPQPTVVNSAPGVSGVSGVSGVTGNGGAVAGRGETRQGNAYAPTTKLSKPCQTSVVSQPLVYPDPSKAKHSTVAMATQTPGMMGSDVSEGIHQLVGPSNDNNSLSMMLPSEMVSRQVGGCVNTSSSTSLMTDIPVADKVTSDKSLDREKMPGGIERQTSVNGKKKSRGKQKQLKLEFQELVDDVVKCTLHTSTDSVDFRFSMEYDKPHTIFKNIVRLSTCSVNYWMWNFYL